MIGGFVVEGSLIGAAGCAVSTPLTVTPDADLQTAAMARAIQAGLATPNLSPHHPPTKAPRQVSSETNNKHLHRS
ncbi:hypothetical protein ACWGID_23170 [Kribbella sp. NPDC054772]